MLLSFGNDEAIVDSASLFVVMYRFGSMGAPAAAEMKTNEGTLWKDASCARVIARISLTISARHFFGNFRAAYPNLCS